MVLPLGVPTTRARLAGAAVPDPVFRLDPGVSTGWGDASAPDQLRRINCRKPVDFHEHRRWDMRNWDMACWQEFAAAEPELSTVVRARLTALRHHVLATVRADGAPRVSGTEVAWYGVDLTLGSMPSARKALDLRRDARFALHGNPGEGGEPTSPDVKISGRAHEVTGAEHEQWVATVAPPSTCSHLFRLDLTEIVTTGLNADHTQLIIRSWRPELGVRVFHRS